MPAPAIAAVAAAFLLDNAKKIIFMLLLVPFVWFVVSQTLNYITELMGIYDNFTEFGYTDFPGWISTASFVNSILPLIECAQLVVLYINFKLTILIVSGINHAIKVVVRFLAAANAVK